MSSGCSGSGFIRGNYTTSSVLKEELGLLQGLLGYLFKESFSIVPERYLLSEVK